jgi:hypothetical protein
MSADLERPGTAAHVRDHPPTAPPAVTVLAPLISPEESSDLERPEAATVEVFNAVTQVTGPVGHQLVPVRRRVQPGPYVSSTRRRVEMLDATTLEDVAAALGQSVSPLVHAVGWEAGVVAAALRSSNSADTRVVLEPLGPPGSPEWTLVDHAAAMLVQSDAHCRESLRHGVPSALLRVVPLASPACPEPVAWADSGARLLGVVGDGVEPVLLESVEALLRADVDLHVVFAGEAARLVRERRLAVVVRGWAAQLTARVHATSKVTWPLLARVDAVLDASTAVATPRAAVAAAAAGRAVAAVVHHPAADLMRHGVDGVVVPGVDPVRLPPAVLEMLGSGAALAAMGGAARERWTREHSPRARAERLAALYDAVAAERSTPEPGAGR